MTLTLERAREIFRYEPETGNLHWVLIKPGIRFDERAGSVNSFSGYRVLQVAGRRYMEHRVIWLLVHGKWPTEIDHINLDKTDNRIDNLREVVRWQNNANHPVRKDSASGLKGVYLHQKSKKWCACIRKDGRQRHLGCFDTKEEAHNAYKQEAQRLFGEFARAA